MYIPVLLAIVVNFRSLLKSKKETKITLISSFYPMVHEQKFPPV